MKPRHVSSLAALLFPLTLGGAACLDDSHGDRKLSVSKPCTDISCDEEENTDRRKKRPDELLTKSVEITGRDGRVTVNGLEVLVTDKDGDPLSNKKVYSLSDGQSHFTFVIDNDQNPRYHPQWTEGRLDQRRDALEDQVRQQLRDPLELIMKIVVTGQEIRQIITDTPRFLMNDDNANVYCMTMPQITDRYVKLPAKIIY